ncbi:MAG TPA: hypothetical protein VF755_24055, partial [Catenuloplanes sp.]
MGGPPAAVVTDAPVDGWRQIAPLRPTIAAFPLVNPVQRFSSSLAAWQDPRSLAPLTHAVGPDEPSGVITMATAPAAHRDDTHPDLPLPAAPRPETAASPPWTGPGRLLAGLLQRLVSPGADPTPASAAAGNPVSAAAMSPVSTATRNAASAAGVSPAPAAAPVVQRAAPDPAGPGGPPPAAASTHAWRATVPAGPAAARLVPVQR